MTEHVPTPHLTDPTVLVTLTGADQSGVSTRLFEQLSNFEIEVIDVEQLIVRGRLVLSALVTVPGDVATFEIHDPLQPHRELVPTYTDRDIHNLTAYLVTLK